MDENEYDLTPLGRWVGTEARLAVDIGVNGFMVGRDIVLVRVRVLG